MKDFKNEFWKYDIDSYERSKKIISLMERTVINPEKIQWWKDRANVIVDKYPHAKLTKL